VVWQIPGSARSQGAGFGILPKQTFREFFAERVFLHFKKVRRRRMARRARCKRAPLEALIDIGS
jgi:hypothetical protein